MPSLPPLAAPAVLARWSGRDPNDPALADALNTASTRFRAAVRHPVTLVIDETLWLDGTGNTVVLLPATPVTAVSLVELDRRAIVDFTWSRTGLLHRTARWPDRLNCLRVVYSHGHAEIPDDVAEAVLQEARYLLALEPGVASMTTGGESVTYTSSAAAMPQAWRDAVSNHSLRGDRP